MVVMDENNQKIFELQRKEIMALGLTQREYQEMVDAGVGLICAANQAIVDGVIPYEKQSLTIRSIVSKLMKTTMNELYYNLRLLRWEMTETDEPKQFLHDRMQLLQILLEDWKTLRSQR